MVLSIQTQAKQKAWILPYVNIQLFNLVLADFAQHFGIGEKKQVVLVID